MIVMSVDLLAAIILGVFSLTTLIVGAGVYYHANK